MSDSIEGKTTRISVSKFVELADPRLDLKVHSRSSVLDRHFLNSQRIQKLGLALSGFAESIHQGRVQIFGNSERSFLGRLDEAKAASAFAGLDRENISCILVTAQGNVGGDVAAFAKGNEIPLLSTGLPSSEATALVIETLAAALAPTTTIHGVMLEVFGVGVLLIGESGIGKSECALELISRGHRLVSDDAVTLKRIGDELRGEAPETIRDFLEIRGLGILNARELFGVSSIARNGKLQLCIEFTGQAEANLQDRLGLDDSTMNLLGLAIERFSIPVTPGRNLAALVEASVRVFVSRSSGTRTVDEVLSRHGKAMTTANRN